MANARAKNKKSTARVSHKAEKTPRAVPKTARKAAAPKAVSRVTHKAAAPKASPEPAKIEKVTRAVTIVAQVTKSERAPESVDAKISSQPEPFRLAAIERADPPAGAAGKNWYRYTIRQGVNAINGYLQGTAAGVKTAAEQIVGQLNERRAGRWGYRTTRAAAPAATTAT